MPENSTAVQPYQRVYRQRESLAEKRSKAHSIKIPTDLLSRESLGTVTALLLLTRLHLLGELAPFGFAFWAVAGRDEKRRMSLYGAVVMLSAATTGSPYYVGSLLISMMVYYLARNYQRMSWLPVVPLVGLALLIGMIPRMWLGLLHTYDFFLLFFEISLAMLAVAVFLQVFKRPFAVLSPDKHLEAITSWIIFAGLLLLSLVQGGAYLSLTAGGIARVIVLWASFLFGPGMAAATGALLGFFLGVQGGGLAWLSILTFAGFLSGLFRPYGRFAIALGFLFGASALSLYLTGWETIPVETSVTTVAILFFLLGPVFPMRVQALAPFLKREQEDEGKRVRDVTAGRIKDYALVFKELAEAFQQAGTLEKEKDVSLAALVETVAERVCKFCPSRRRCWEKDLHRTYNSMLRVLADLNNGQNIKEIRSPEFFQKYCRKKDDFLATLSFVRELDEVNDSWHKRLEDNRQLVTLQLSGLSQIMLDLSKEVREGVPEQLKRVKNQYFHVEIGVAQAAKGAEEVCGDYYSYLELRDGKQAFLISDGMGNGPRAYQESSSAVQLVEQLLLAGFRREPIVRTVNTILQLRSQDEIFATLDALLVDTEKGEAEFIKIGAAPSFMRSQGRVREIRSPSVPLGILNEVEVKQVRVGLDDDTLLVMVTDGIFDVHPSNPGWLKSYLAGHVPSHPQVLADEIIHQANVFNGSAELRDDITVLVCSVKRLKYKVRDFATG
ncbi:MAG: SpoIIE family protein phosphatase [Clostridiales bacterium]|jgi:stage II sporulation protein E|nr:SpoIIE family protein phosphatase [Clostridiales bacterium]